MSAEWKRPVSREEYYDISRIAALRGKYKARKRAITFERRHSQYIKREDAQYQSSLGLWYRNNFSL